MSKRKVLIAPLNWGLGHASRCIPLIQELEAHNFAPLIASDGQALRLLKKEFPHLKHLTLPSYNITYSRKKSTFRWHLLKQAPHILRTIRKEFRATQKIIDQESLVGIISDNRYGVRSSNVPSIFMTHQLKVLSGPTTFLTSRIQQSLIRNFDQCWVPDSPGNQNLSGLLGHLPNSGLQLRYLGILSRFEKKAIPIKYDYMVLLSGPEPQRTLLENFLLKTFKMSSKQILFVRGVITDEPIKIHLPNVHVHNYMFGKELEWALNSSKVILSRSGYSSLMDFAKLKKQVFLIPTPGQPEQEYLARRMQKFQMAPMSSQNDFHPSMLKLTQNYTGLSIPHFRCDFGDLFSLFNRE